MSQVQSLAVVDRTRPVHFVGAGGVGMSGLAKLLLEAGFQVSGSDLNDSAYIQQLKMLGGHLHIGHQAENVPDNATVIVSTAIHTENPEIAKAMQLGLPIYHRSQLLRELFQGETFSHEVTVGLTGTHGKTTMTGMTGVALHAAGLDPTIIAGGKIPTLGTNAVYGQQQRIAVAELDESDGTILAYQPTHTVIANLELDHADHFTNGLTQIVETFETFLKQLQPEATVFFNVGCPTTAALLAKCDALNPQICPILLAQTDQIPPGEKRPAYWLKNARAWKPGVYQAYVYRNQRMLGELNLSVPGTHNLMNALCAIAVGHTLGADFDQMAEALSTFSGMGRRFEKVGECHGATLIDDYAHHPTEVAVTLKAAKELLKGSNGRLFVVFQPHRFTRLQALWSEFLACFEAADHLWITDVFAASEAPLEGVSAESFVQALIARGHEQEQVAYLPKTEWAGFKQGLAEQLRPGDLVLSMGAGDVTRLLR